MMITKATISRAYSLAAEAHFIEARKTAVRARAVLLAGRILLESARENRAAGR